MCDEITPYEAKDVIGYKVVAKKGDRYYSLLTGNPYPRDGRIPKWRSQRKQLTQYFVDYVLDPDMDLFRKEMVGNTAMFVDDDAALRFRECIRWQTRFTAVAVKIRLANVKYTAFWRCEPVLIGNGMTILEELKEDTDDGTHNDQSDDA